MERRLQEHQQELDTLGQEAELTKQKVSHEASLKTEAAEVRALQLHVDTSSHSIPLNAHHLSILDRLRTTSNWNAASIVSGRSTWSSSKTSVWT